MNKQSVNLNQKINQRQLALDTIRYIVTIVEVIQLSEHAIQQVKMCSEKFFSIMEKKIRNGQQVIKLF